MWIHIRKAFLITLTLFLGQCGCSRFSEANNDTDTSCSVNQGSNRSYDENITKNHKRNNNSESPSQFTIPLEVKRSRHGFGRIGKHGEKRISFLSSPDCSLDASNNLVVYCDSKGKLYIIDLQSEVEKEIGGQFLDGISAICYPSIHNNIVVFQAIRSDKVDDPRFDIGVCNLKTMKCFWLTGTASRKLPRVNKNYIVWQDYRYFNTSDQDFRKWRNSEIYLYCIDLGLERRLTDAKYQQMEPDVFGDYVVWRDNREWNQTEIYSLHIPTGQEKNITNNVAHQWAPRVGERGIVWTDLRNGSGDILGHRNADIFYYDFTSGKTIQITDDPFSQEHPKIYGKYIIWNDMRNGSISPNGYPSGADVYLFDLESMKEKRVSWTPENDGAARITGNTIIWNHHGRNGCALFAKELDRL